MNTYNGDPPGHSGKAGRGNHHGDKDDPERLLSIVTDELVLRLRGQDSRERSDRGSCGGRCGQRRDERGRERDGKNALRLHGVNGVNHHDGCCRRPDDGGAMRMGEGRQRKLGFLQQRAAEAQAAI